MTDLTTLFGLKKSDTAYPCILADPPWLERGGGKIKRGADRHYPLLKTRDIPGVMQKSPVWNPADNGHLWLWVTNNFLEDGLWVMKTLGYRYITNAVWVKDRVGLGQYMRGQHELLLFGTRGKALVPTPENRPPTVIQAPRQKHSQKPDEFYQLIETISPGPYLEIFARRPRPGWDAWGNEEIEDNDRRA